MTVNRRYARQPIKAIDFAIGFFGWTLIHIGILLIFNLILQCVFVSSC
jgi:hypothetical protein